MLINIDAGHGSNTAGKRTPPFTHDVKINDRILVKKGEQFREHIANVGVAMYLVNELERCGIKTMRTGWDDENAYDDEDTSLTTRQRQIAKAGCDYSISIHFNAFGDGKSFNSAEGVLVYIHDKYIEQSLKLAETVISELAQGTKQKNRGVVKQSLAMVNCNNMNVKAAILVELGFMTNLREATELMANEEFWKECACEIAKGVCKFTGIKYIPDTYMPSKTITSGSSKDDIKWAQEKLNAVLPSWFPKLKVDGSYGPKTRIAVLIYWDSLEWGKHLKDDGTRIGSATIKALAIGKIK